MTTNVSVLINGQTYCREFTDAREVMLELQPTEPLYLFSRDRLLCRALAFQQGFAGTLGYAVKANSEPRVIRGLASQGIRDFDVASLGEVAAIACLCPAATLHFNNPVKAVEAIGAAYFDYGVRSFALDEMTELDKIRKATGNATDIMCSVRFKLGHEGASYDFGSKFGATPDKAAALLRKVAAFGARPALTFHPGSQCTKPQMYARYLEAAAAIIRASGVEVDLINVGGGFPEHYENAGVPALDCYFDAIDEAVLRYFKRPPPLMCEPGRAMVAASVSLLARVIHVREDQRILFVNDGVYGGMLEQSVVDLSLPVALWRSGMQPLGVAEAYAIFGPTCDPVDRLARQVEIPCQVEEGDYIEFGLMGAYASATATGFNGFRSTAYCNVARGFSACPMACAD
jgi:ornithine decarboxylase